MKEEIVKDNGTTSDSNKQVEREVLTDLKVKGDRPDIAPEDRKKSVKKLAGAISHSLRATGEINVRCFGNASIGKGAKALAIARSYIGIQELQLECSPAFISYEIEGREITGIAFCTFASNGAKQEVDLDSLKSIFKVKADAKDISAKDKKTNVKKLASAITHALVENREVAIRCLGNATIGKASKALAIARGFIATRGSDLYCWPTFVVTTIDGQEKTGICFYAYTNAI